MVCVHRYGQKIKGKKRHLLIDTQGLLRQAIVHAVYIQDRDGTLFGMCPFLRKLDANGSTPGMPQKTAVAFRIGFNPADTVKALLENEMIPDGLYRLDILICCTAQYDHIAVIRADAVPRLGVPFLGLGR